MLSSLNCRCTPPLPCFDAVPWDTLNASVHGRLRSHVDPFDACAAKASSTACVASLNSSDNEFWLTAQPAGYLHNGLFNSWNISSRISPYVVAAMTEQDVAAGLAFAHKHNLRVAVKSTGHDWFSRSSAPGSLLIWTHLMKAIDFHDGYVADGCPARTAHSVARLGAGVQFSELYPAAEEMELLVNGGTCDSVGIGGCFLGGCFGVFTRKFGSAATNLVSARVALANGTIVTATECNEHADLFYTLRGGGGGGSGVVTEFTVRAFPAPRSVGSATFVGSANTTAEFEDLLDQVLGAAVVSVDHAQNLSSNGGMEFGANSIDAASKYRVHISMQGYEADPAAVLALFAPLTAWVAEAQASGREIGGTTSSSVWNSKDYSPSLPPSALNKPAWMEIHPDREISVELIDSMGRYIPLRPLRSPAGRRATAKKFVAITNGIHDITRLGVEIKTNVIMFAKAQSGMSAAVEHAFNQTAQNPVLLQTIGELLLYYPVPSLPTVAHSVALLRTIWPRIQQYVVQQDDTPLWATCDAGARGDVGKMHECFHDLATHIAVLQTATDSLKRTLFNAFPLTSQDGAPMSGYYLNEGTWRDEHWREAQWGNATYARLVAVKAKYDPHGLFTCHHCVASQQWSEDGNCKVT